MSDGEWWAQQFEESRGRLRAVAYRILGSHSEAGDAVQPRRRGGGSGAPPAA